MLTNLILPLLAAQANLLINSDFTAPIESTYRLRAAEAQILTEGGRRFLRLRSAPKPDAPAWEHSIHQPIGGKIDKGDTILVKVRLRSPDGFRTSFIVEQASEPFDKFVNEGIVAPKDWRAYEFAGIADKSYAPGESQLTAFLGFNKGTLDVSDLSIQNLGKRPIQSLNLKRDYYGGLPNPQDWRKAAEARIEEHRKGPITVFVRDASNRPIANASVKIEQVRHSFRFGTAVPAHRIVSNDPDDVRFRQELKRLFNTVVFENDHKWQTLGERDYTQVDQAMAWLVENDFEIRGHNLVWGSQRNLPRGLWDKSDAEILAILEKRVKETVDRFEGTVYAWDVVNEAVTERELWDRIGWDKFVQVFKWAREADPKLKLVYNEFDITEEANGSTHRKKAIERIRYLIDNGTPLDKIGIQGHVSVPMTPASRVVEILAEMGSFGPQLEITEYDLGVWDDAVYAKHLEEFLTACFAEPRMESFLFWGFWEGSHWRAKVGAAIFRKDWTERLPVKTWLGLVKGKWWTNANIRTNRNGEATTRAFNGRHRITVQVGGKQVVTETQLPPYGKSVSVVVM